MRTALACLLLAAGCLASEVPPASKKTLHRVADASSASGAPGTRRVKVRRDKDGMQYADLGVAPDKMDSFCKPNFSAHLDKAAAQGDAHLACSGQDAEADVDNSHAPLLHQREAEDSVFFETESDSDAEGGAPAVGDAPDAPAEGVSDGEIEVADAPHDAEADALAALCESDPDVAACVIRARAAQHDAASGA